MAPVWLELDSQSEKTVSPFFFEVNNIYKAGGGGQPKGGVFHAYD